MITKQTIATATAALPLAVAFLLPKPALAGVGIILGGHHVSAFISPTVVVPEPYPVAPQPAYVVPEPYAVAPPPAYVVPEPYAAPQRVWIRGHWDYTPDGRYWIPGHYEER